MNRDKESAAAHFMDVTRHSWTWGKMTKEEQRRFYDVLPDELKGTYDQRYSLLNAIYRAYLQGLGYTGMGWRDIKI